MQFISDIALTIGLLLKVELSPSKKTSLFASIIALQK